MLTAGDNLKTVRRLAWLARLLVIAAFFILWKQFDVAVGEALKYCFTAWVIVHALMRVLRPVARVLDRARSRAMIVVGIAKFLVTLALPVLWKGLDVPFWRAALICAVIYFALDRIWRTLDARALRELNRAAKSV